MEKLFDDFYFIIIVTIFCGNYHVIKAHNLKMPFSCGWGQVLGLRNCISPFIHDRWVSYPKTSVPISTEKTNYFSLSSSNCLWECKRRIYCFSYSYLDNMCHLYNFISYDSFTTGSYELTVWFCCIGKLIS